MDLIVGKTYYNKMYCRYEVVIRSFFDDKVTYEKTDKRWNINTRYDSSELFETITCDNFRESFCDDLEQYKIDALKRKIKSTAQYIQEQNKELRDLKGELHELQNKKVPKETKQHF